jgi:DNA-directed RNA polymerase specialized sigma24 family protein
MYFPTTHWSLLARATINGETEARSALEQLCHRYWSPLKSFIRSRGYEEAEAEDLTQDFLLHLLERSALRKPDPLRGRFRSFLLGALSNFLSHERERRLAQKRGGTAPHLGVETLEQGEHAHQLSLPEQDVAAFDRAWALAVLRAALAVLGDEYGKAGKGELFVTLRAFLPGAQLTPSYEDAAAHAGVTVAAFNSEIHRLRHRFRDCVCAEVTATVSAPHEIEQELAHLYHVLLDRGTDLRAAESPPA